MPSNLYEKGEETSVIAQKCYLSMRCSLVPSVAKRSNGSSRMLWDILHGSQTACEMRQLHPLHSVKTRLPSKAYAELFPECREVIAKKRQERLNKAKDQEQTSTTATPASRPSTTGRTTGTVRSSTAAAVAPLLCRNASPHQISAAISRSLASRKGSSTPNIPASRTPAASTTQVPAVRNATPAVMSISPSQSPESNDEELCSIADKVEHELGIYNIKHDILLNC